MGKSHFNWHKPLIVFAATTVLALFVTAGAESAEVKSTEPSTAATQAPSAIPLADIAAKAAEASSLISNLTISASRLGQVNNIANSLPALGKRLDERLRETKEALDTEPTLETLQTLQQGLGGVKEIMLGRLRS